MSAQRKTILCREGWCYLFVLGMVLAGAMMREINLLLMLACLLAGPLLLSWPMMAATLRGLKIARRLPQGVYAGDLLVVNLELANTRRRLGSWAVVVEETIDRPDDHPDDHPDGGPVRPRVFFPYVRAGHARQAAYRGRLARRGRYEVGPLRVSTRFPFGLWRRTITLGRSDSLIIYPRLGRLTRDWVTRRHESFEGAQQRQQRYIRREGEFFGVRDWRSGDSRRWIHWRSSARRDKLVVRQFEQPHNRDVVVLVDLWKPAHPKVAGNPTPTDVDAVNAGTIDVDAVELAVSFAATVIADLCRKGGAEVWLGTTGKRPPGKRPRCTSGPASPILLQDAMEHLAVAQSDGEDHLAELLDDVLGQIRPGTEVVLITTRPVDLTDTSRWGTMWTDPARRAMIGRIRCVDTSGTDWERYFQVQ